MLPKSGKPGGGWFFFFLLVRQRPGELYLLGEYLPRVGLGTPAPETLQVGSSGQQENGVHWEAGKDVHQLVK